MNDEHQKQQPPPLARTAIRGLCPACGAPTLYRGLIEFAPKCRACGLDFTRYNVGDGPAAFLTLIVGAVLIVLALSLELSAHPPFYVHVILWVPLTTVAVIGALRVSKAALVWAEHRNDAREGTLADKPSDIDDL